MIRSSRLPFATGRCFEFCAGPGFIGFMLLAAGICDTLVLGDVNPRAVAAARATLAESSNAHLRRRVTVYHSDVLADIPEAGLRRLGTTRAS